MITGMNQTELATGGSTLCYKSAEVKKIENDSIIAKQEAIENYYKGAHYIEWLRAARDRMERAD